MLDLTKNLCRFCRMLFCCEKCRTKHEINEHKININCEICLYGEGVIHKQYPEELLNHIEDTHCPIYCKKCNKTFESASAIIEHINQPVKEKMENVTPVERNVSTPPFPATPFQGPGKYLHDIIDLATSTPLPNNQDGRVLGNNVFLSTLTPVENAECESLNKGPEGKTMKNQENKHITFCGTPSVETQRVIKDLSHIKKAKILNVLEKEHAIMYENFKKEDNAEAEKHKLRIIEENVEGEEHTHLSEKNDKSDKETTKKSSSDDLQGKGDNYPSIIKKLTGKENEQSITEKLTDEDNDQSITEKLTDKAPRITFLIGDQNSAEETTELISNNDILAEISKINNENTLWKSAINISTSDSEYEIAETTINSKEEPFNSKSMWASLTCVVNSVMNFSKENNKFSGNTKRLREEDESKNEHPVAKRVKQWDIKCRPPIRNLDTVIYLRRNRPIMVDKWTQTD